MPLFQDLPVEDETLSAPDLARLLGLPQPPPYRARSTEPDIAQLFGTPEAPPYRAPIDQTPDLAMPDELGPLEFTPPTAPPYRARVQPAARRHVPAPFTSLDTRTHTWNNGVQAPIDPAALAQAQAERDALLPPRRMAKPTPWEIQSSMGAPTMGVAGVPLPAAPPSMQIDPEPIYRATKQSYRKFADAVSPLMRNNPELGGAITNAPPTPDDFKAFQKTTEELPMLPLSAGAQPGTAMHGVLSGLESASTPTNLLMAAGMALSGGVGGTGMQALHRGLGTYFGWQMAKGAGKNVSEAYDAYKKDPTDLDTVAEKLGQAGVQGVLAVLGLKNIKGAKDDLFAGIDRQNAANEAELQKQLAIGRQQANKAGNTVLREAVAQEQFGEPIPVKIGGAPARVELTGVDDTGRTAFRVVDEATGNTLFGGRGPDVRSWLASRGAQIPEGLAPDLSSPTPIVAEAPARRGALNEQFGASAQPGPAVADRPITEDDLGRLQSNPDDIRNPRKQEQRQKTQEEIANRVQLGLNQPAAQVDPLTGLDTEFALNADAAQAPHTVVQDSLVPQSDGTYLVRDMEGTVVYHGPLAAAQQTIRDRNPGSYFGKSITAAEAGVNGASPVRPAQEPAEGGSSSGEPPQEEQPAKIEAAPPSKVEKPSDQTPNAPTAFKRTAPEKPETIAIQMEQLAAGIRKTVMIPEGTPQPTSFGDNISVTGDGLGNTYAYRRDLTSESEIKAAAKGDKLPGILGDAITGLQAPDKKALDLSPGEKFTVVVRAADGTEVQSTATDEEHLSATLAAHERLVPPGGTVHVEPAEKVLAERAEAMEAPADLEAEPTPITAGTPARPTKTAGPNGIPFAPYLDLSKAPPGALEQPEATLEDAKAARDEYRQQVIESARAHLKQHPDTPPENLAAQYGLGKNQAEEIYRESGVSAPVVQPETDAPITLAVKDKSWPTVHKYDVLQGGSKLGEIAVGTREVGGGNPDKATTLDISFQSDPNAPNQTGKMTDAGPVLDVSRTAIRDVINQIADLYPNATAIESNRQTGIRERNGALFPARIDLEKVRARRTKTEELSAPAEIEAPREERRATPRATTLDQPDLPSRAEEDAQLAKDIHEDQLDRQDHRGKTWDEVEERFGELRDRAEDAAREHGRLTGIAGDPKQPERNREIARDGAKAAREQVDKAFRELGDAYGEATYILRQRLGEQYGLEGRYTRPKLKAPITYFTGGAAHYEDVQKAGRERNDLGLVITPKTGHYAEIHQNYPHVMVDNGVFSKEGFKEDAFRRLLDRIDKSPALKKKIQFVVAPDVMVHDEETGDVRGDAEATLAQFDKWADELHARDLPVAFVAQPGIEDMLDDVPWDKVDTLFIGGHKPWKFGHEEATGKPGSAAAKAWIKIFSEAHKRRIPIHVGRVYRAKDIEHVHANLGVRSVDSTHIAFEPSKALPFMLKQLDRWNVHGRLPKLYDEGDMIRAEEELERQINSGETEAPGKKATAGDLEAPAEIETKSEGTPAKAESPVTWLNDDFGNFSVPDGTKLVSKSGRPLAPSPKFDAETSRKRKLSLTRQRTWLVDEARKEAAAKGDGFMQTLLKGADPNNYPRATADMVNEYLFGDPTGPVESSFAQNTAEPVKQAPKSRPAPKPKADLEAPAEMADGPFDPVRALVEDAAKGDPEDDRFPPLKILDAREVHAQKVEVEWDPHQNRETHVIAGKTEDGQPVVGYVIERDGAIHPDLLPEWFVGEQNIRADAKGRGMWDSWLPAVIDRALAKSEKIEAHDRGEGAAGSRNEPVRDERPESLEGVQAEDVRGSGEAEDALPGGVGSGYENVGSPAGTPVRASEDELRPGEGDGVQGVVSTPGRTGTTKPDVQSNPVTTSLSDDFRLTPEQAAEIENGGSRTKARNNIEAIRTIKKIIEEGGRPATLEEQHKLAKYVGWGDSELAQGIFKNRPEWRGIREDLKSLLTDEEMDAAEESTLNAHYTRRDVAAAMWDALVRMGFRAGGSILEPGMGIGNFFMMMPEDLLPGTTRTGVEMDLLTGAMAKAMYPGSNIVVKPYQHTNLPDGYFDSAIGNVPFSKHQVIDPTFKRQPYLTQNVHNYFFAKSMQKLRPGGVMLAITARGTMDSQGKAFREWMSKEAELLGAIRLPRDTFKANAGTSVTVDIVALRKRTPDGIPVSSETWIESQEMTTEDGIKVNINEYFHRHPEMMLGKMEGGSQYHRGYPELFGKFSMEALKEALDKLPADVIPAWASQTGARDNQVENYPEAAHIKDQQFGIVNGAVVQREGAYFRPVTLKGKKLERMKGMIELRGSAREVVRTQTMGLSEPEILDARRDLNKVYDAFIAKHGPVNGMGNALIFADDPDWGMLSGLLEDYDKGAYIAVPKEAKGGGKWEVKGNDVSLVHGKTRYRIAGKRPIFRERTNEKPARIEKVDTGAEALAVSLNELGRMDWDRMQELTGSDPEDLQKELAGKIFRHPVSRQWETADEYLSGNVRQKLKDAQFAAERHPEFEANVEALKAVQPPDKEAGKIKVSLGATWVPDADYADFAKEILKAEARPEPGAERGTTRPIVSYVVQTGGFGVNASYQFSDDGVANQTEYGNAYFTGMALFEMALNGRTPVARDTEYDMDGNEREVKNPDATIESVEKQQRLNDKFTEWIWSDVDRAKRLALKFNEERNNLRLREFDGSHLTFPGLNKTWLRNGEPDPHQKNVVWRTIQSGNTLYAHVVGSGKTLEMIMAAMELKRLGLRKKSSVVVPNHLVGQWRDDWMRAYPAAQILVPTKKDFEKVNRQRLMARIASGNYDAVIMGHNSFEKLSVRDDTFNEFVDSQLKEINDALDVARSGLSKKDEFKDPTIKQLRRRKAQLEAKLEKRSKRDEKDTGLNFEDLGIDQIFVDEADLFKNLGYMTMMDRIAGLPNTDSNRATDMLLKTQYVGKLHGGDRGVVFATGTPVSNSIAEIWTMMRYLMPTYLEREGMDQFDSWAKTFGKTRTQMEVAPEGGRFIQRTRFAKFQNAGQMMSMFRLVADIKVAKQLNLPTPAIYKGGYVDVVAKATDELKAFVEHIGERADAIRSGQVKPEDDNMLLISSDGRKASLDMRLVSPRAKEDPDSKVNKAVKNILDIYKEFGEHKATQLVFLDLSTPKSEKVRKKKAPASDEVANTDAEAESDLYGEKDEEEETEVETGEEARERFTVYGNIKRKLIEGGLKPEEVAFIQDAKTDAQKLALFSKVNAGEVRVLLGSTEGMGAGTNVQQRLIALHHLDAPWRPRDMAQRDGRIVRQGNQLYNNHKIPVRLYRYMTEGSFDAFMWETLAAKAGPIEQLMEGDPNMDEVEEMSPFVMSFEQAKAASTGNPLIREKIILDQDVHKLSIMRGSWLNEQATVARQLVEVPPQIKRYEDGIRDFEADIKTRDANADLVVDGKSYAGKEIRAEGAPALIKVLEKLGPIAELTPINATYRGFKLAATPQNESLEYRAKKKGDFNKPGEYYVREKQPDGKYLYFRSSSKYIGGSYTVAREEYGLKPVPKEKAEQIHEVWNHLGKDAKEWADYGYIRFHTSPNLRLEAKSGNSAIIANYSSPAGTIQSADFHLQFEESLREARNQLQRLEKKLTELESKRGEPFQQEEKLQTMLRRQSELAMQLGEGGNDLQALRAAEDGDEGSSSKNPLTPFLKDPRASMHAKWFPQKRYFGAGSGRAKNTIKGHRITPELGVHEVAAATRGGQTSWQVDHIPSGMFVRRFLTDYEAVAYARQAGKALDWNWATPPEGFEAKLRDFTAKFKPPSETPEQSRQRLQDLGELKAADQRYVTRGEGETDADNSPLTTRAEGEGVYLGFGLGALQPAFDVAGKAVKDYAMQDALPKVAALWHGTRETAEGLAHLISPVSGVDSDTVKSIFEMKGGREAAQHLLRAKMKKWSKRVDQMTQAEMVEFIDRQKTGQRQADRELQTLSRFMRKVDDALYREIEKYHPSVSYLDNHYRVLWKVIPGSPQARGGFKGSFKRPIRGSRGMLKQAKLVDMSEGLRLGGVPHTYNPIKNFELAYQDSMKFITAQRMWEDFANKGIRKFVRKGRPEPAGYVKLKDAIAKVYFPVNQGLVDAGDWYVEQGAARMLNNYLGEDHIRRHAAGRFLMWMKNASTAIELSISPFHAVFEGNEAVGSQIGMGLREIWNIGVLKGDVKAAGRGLKTLATAPGAFYTVAHEGHMAKQAFEDWPAFSRSAAGQEWLKKYPEARQDLKDFFDAGGIMGQHEDFKTSAVAGFKEYMRSASARDPKNYISAAFKSIPALNQSLMKPLFEKYIPNLKLGFFMREYALVRREYADRIASGEVTLDHLARSVIRSIDNRFGEMNYDNLFWDRTFKTANQLMFRSVTWKLGNLRANADAVGGAYRELARSITGGGPPKLDMNTSWLFGMTFWTAIMGSVITFLATGKRPKELKDFVYPAIDEANHIRVSLPTYWRDLLHLAHSPVGYVKSSLSGEIGRVADIWQNKDFYGNEVYSEDDPFYEQAWDAARHMVPLPFSVSSGLQAKQEGGSAVARSAGYLGFTKAPRYVEQSDAEQLASDFLNKHREIGSRTRAQSDRSQARAAIRNIYRHGGDARKEVGDAEAKGYVKPADIPKLRMEATKGDLARAVHSLSGRPEALGELLRIYDVATPEERKSIEPDVRRKVMASRLKPYLWNEKSEALASKYFHVRPAHPKAAAAPMTDLGTPASLEGTA